MYETVFEVLLIITPNWNQHKCLLIGEWINRWQHIHTMEYYTEIKKNKQLKQLIPQHFLNERSYTPKSIFFMIPFI